MEQYHGKNKCSEKEDLFPPEEFLDFVLGDYIRLPHIIFEIYVHLASTP